MQVQERDIAYEVTISDELRALLRARANSAPAQSADLATGASNAAPRSRSVFSKRRLRVDGRRPMNVSASEILTFRVGSDASEPESGRGGHQRLSILLTEDGNCLGHMVAEPPEGLAARPVYRLGRMQTPEDVLGIIRECRDDVRAAAACTGGLPEDGLDGHAFHLLEHQFEQMSKTLAPFVETQRN